VCMCMRTYTYAYIHMRARCLKSISILFPSNPIHELRLDLNVANTVLALTIRVIYLSLIITLKRGVVVLWFTVTCPLSSGFSIVNIRRRTSRSVLSYQCAHSQQASKKKRLKYPNRRSIHVCTGTLVLLLRAQMCVYVYAYVCTRTRTHVRGV